MKFTAPRVAKLMRWLTEDWLGQSLEFMDRGQLFPPLPTVYFLLDNDGEVVYVGHTASLQRRMRQHENNPRMSKLLWSRAAFIGDGGISYRSDRLAVETIGIVTLRPKGNRAVLLNLNAQRQLVEIRLRRRHRPKGKKSGT